MVTCRDDMFPRQRAEKGGQVVLAEGEEVPEELGQEGLDCPLGNAAFDFGEEEKVQAIG